MSSSVRGPKVWRRILSLAVLFTLLLTVGAVARDKKEKKGKMDPTKGDILLAGLVYSPDSGSGNSALGAGMSAVKGAKVTLQGTQFFTETDVNGMFVFTDGPEGPGQIVITKEGYRTVTRAVVIDKDKMDSGGMRIEMLPAGTNYVGSTPTGAGTLYVAYSQRVVDHSQPGGHTTWDRNLQTVSAAIAAGADPLTLENNQAGVTRNPVESEWNPTNDAPNSIMILPPNAPSLTGFHNTSASPYWLCFDKSGETLYVANSAHQIQVMDAKNENRVISSLPAQQNGVVTSLALSADGKYVMGTVMAVTPGVMMIDTATRQPAAYLTIDGMGTMTPTAIASSPDGSRLYVTLNGVAAQNGEGLLVAIDPYTGVTLGQAKVGSAPTGVALSTDGRLAYVANSGSGNVTVVDAWSMAPIGLLTVGVSPQKVAATPDGKRILVTNKGSATVSVIDTQSNSIVGTVNVGNGPLGIAVSPNSQFAYVANKDDGTVSLINIRSMSVMHVTDPMPKSSPYGVAVRP